MHVLLTYLLTYLFTDTLDRDSAMRTWSVSELVNLW